MASKNFIQQANQWREKVSRYKFLSERWIANELNEQLKRRFGDGRVTNIPFSQRYGLIPIFSDADS